MTDVCVALRCVAQRASVLSEQNGRASFVTMTPADCSSYRDSQQYAIARLWERNFPCRSVFTSKNNKLLVKTSFVERGMFLERDL